MKIRVGFVSNSSSSSFVLSRRDVTPEQFDAIVNHIDAAKGLISPEYWDRSDEWNVKLGRKYIYLETMMDNFDMKEFLEKIGVSLDKLVIHVDGGEDVSAKAKKQSERNIRMWQREARKEWKQIKI